MEQSDFIPQFHNFPELRDKSAAIPVPLGGKEMPIHAAIQWVHASGSRRYQANSAGDISPPKMRQGENSGPDYCDIRDPRASQEVQLISGLKGFKRAVISAKFGLKIHCPGHESGPEFPQLSVGGMTGGIAKRFSADLLIYHCFKIEI